MQSSHINKRLLQNTFIVKKPIYTQTLQVIVIEYKCVGLAIRCSERSKTGQGSNTILKTALLEKYMP